jgi:hypothetical protein
MLVLVETPAGYGLFKVVDKAKVKDVDNLMDAFATPEAAATVYVSLRAAFASAPCAIACLTRVCRRVSCVASNSSTSLSSQTPPPP